MFYKTVPRDGFFPAELGQGAGRVSAGRSLTVHRVVSETRASRGRTENHTGRPAPAEQRYIYINPPGQLCEIT